MKKRRIISILLTFIMAVGVLARVNPQVHHQIHLQTQQLLLHQLQKRHWWYIIRQQEAQKR